MMFFKHFRTVNEHRMYVMKYCFKAGLYRQGLMHDLSKYSWTEFSVGAKYYQGNRSPNNAEREEKGYSSSWLHHKGRNKHHFEYWIDYSLDPNEVIGGLKMPRKYVVEMFCDRIAACKVYQKEKYTDRSPLNYLDNGPGKKFMHEDTRAELYVLMNMLADEGEDKVFEYIRNVYLKGK